MALLGAFRSLVARSSIGKLLELKGAITENALTKWLFGKYNGSGRYTYQEFQAIARQTARTVATGERIQQGPRDSVNVRQLPRDPTIRQDEGPFRYKVLIVASNRRGDVLRTAIDIDSTELLTPDELETIAEDRYRSRSLDGKYRNEVNAVGTNARITTIVLAAGRA